jgi:LmbE family N-acetylglucosaminyl deacetylase
MSESALKLLILGAHPDDCEFHAGGLAARYRRLGHSVKMISVTPGDVGHHEISGPPLAKVRTAEAVKAAAVIGAISEVWDFPDGSLTPSLDLRWRIIREIRTYRPNVVLAHRPNDYHPDHRAVGQAVQDASYLVTVPKLLPDVPIVAKDPIVGSLPDAFTKPTPLQGDVVLDVGNELDTITRMLACYDSQVFNWLPYNRGILHEVPQDPEARFSWLRKSQGDRLREQANRFRKELIATYGPERGAKVEFAEVFEISEYASKLDASAKNKLFPLD